MYIYISYLYMYIILSLNECEKIKMTMNMISLSLSLSLYLYIHYNPSLNDTDDRSSQISSADKLPGRGDVGLRLTESSSGRENPNFEQTACCNIWAINKTLVVSGKYRGLLYTTQLCGDCNKLPFYKDPC